MTTRYFNIKEHIVEASYVREYPRALANNQEDDLKLHIKQYTPKQSPRCQKTFTIIGGHANAFPKELYEPLWDELYERCASNGFHIGSVWIADVAWQGQSSILNEGLLGNDPSWYDHCRDVLHMINTFRKEMPLPLVGIGHSMGANQLINVSLMHPRLFASLIMIDPVVDAGRGTANSGYGGAWASTHRRDTWPSREAAIASYNKSPFYRAWDPRVLELWNKFGLRDLPTALYPDSSNTSPKPVTLTTPKTQEVWTFLRPNYGQEGKDGKSVIDRENYGDVDPTLDVVAPFYRPEVTRTFQRIPNLKPPTYFIFGGKSNLGSQEQQYQKVPHTGIGIGGSGGVKAGKVDHVFIKDLGHLVPMEDPKQTAEFASKWLGKLLGAWYKADEEFRSTWSAASRRDKMTVSQQWIDNIGPPPKRGKPKAKL